MNKLTIIILLVLGIVAIAAYRYYGPASTGCGCSNCPCEQVTEEVVVEVPAEEVVVKEEAASQEKHNDCCCGQACADEKHNDVK